MKTSDIIQLITTIFAALMAGLFYSYSCSVSLGLGKLYDGEYIRAMQSINREIQNPVFFLCFMGLLALLPVCVYFNYVPSQGKFKLLLAATIVYFVGVFGVTAFGNVPMNEALDRFNVLASTADVIKTQRAAFESKWNVLNHIRTISSIVTLVLLLLALADKRQLIAENFS